MSVTTPANQTLVLARKLPNLKVYMFVTLAIVFTPCVMGLITLIPHR
jgi:hypothetical protein